MKRSLVLFLFLFIFFHASKGDVYYLGSGFSQSLTEIFRNVTISGDTSVTINVFPQVFTGRENCIFGIPPNLDTLVLQMIPQTMTSSIPFFDCGDEDSSRAMFYTPSPHSMTIQLTNMRITTNGKIFDMTGDIGLSSFLLQSCELSSNTDAIKLRNANLIIRYSNLISMGQGISIINSKNTPGSLDINTLYMQTVTGIYSLHTSIALVQSSIITGKNAIQATFGLNSRSQATIYIDSCAITGYQHPISLSQLDLETLYLQQIEKDSLNSIQISNSNITAPFGKLMYIGYSSASISNSQFTQGLSNSRAITMASSYSYISQTILQSMYATEVSFIELDNCEILRTVDCESSSDLFIMDNNTAVLSNISSGNCVEILYPLSDSNIIEIVDSSTATIPWVEYSPSGSIIYSPSTSDTPSGWEYFVLIFLMCSITGIFIIFAILAILVIYQIKHQPKINNQKVDKSLLQTEMEVFDEESDA